MSRNTSRKRNLTTQNRMHLNNSALSPIEQQIIAEQKALREMTPDQRKKKLDDEATLLFLGINR